ncbi:transglutaminaseTgpA domain-containing protein [Nonomuraea sp. NPDC000554]|uniref:DUF3488 and transglutaminase-like domain-containing protein n=1 Tax=Nonomuraea sp. NPDC000554 TaxID=3154259 RepID=UPI00331EC3FA
MAAVAPPSGDRADVGAANGVPLPGAIRQEGTGREAPRPDPGGEVRRVAAVSVVALLACAAGLAFDGVFTLGALVPVVVVASVAPCVLSALLAWRLPVAGGGGRVPLRAGLSVSALAWLVAVSATVYRAEAFAGFVPSPASVRAALLGVRDAWKALLTTILPADDAGRTVVFAHFLVWVAAVAGAELALRTRTVVLPAAPAVLVLAVAVVLGVGGAGSRLPSVAVFAGLVLLLALVRAAGSVRTVLLGVPLLVCLTLVAVAAGPVLPRAARPYDVRQLVEPPPARPIKGMSPLDQVSGWLQNPYRELFTVRSAAEENWRLAVLDRFDGVTWTSSAGFVPTGGRVPVQDGDGPRDVVQQQVTLQKLPGPWLPAADRPRQVSGTGLLVDPATGMLAAAAPREGITYRVTSDVRRYSAAELREAVPTANPRALELPDGPDGRTPPQRARLRAVARRATSGATSPMQQAAGLAAYLRKHAVNDVNAPPGHSYRSIQFFLTESRKGTTEQFATSYALLARTLGLPTRVVVGFRPGAAGKDGTRQVLAGDVLAWAEVEFAGIGWVPFYPTPSRSRSGRRGDVAEGVSKQQQQIEQQLNSDNARPQPTPTPTKPSPTQAPRPGRPGSATSWLPLAGAAAATLLAGYLLLVLALPPLRRTVRRRARDPRVRLAGAWRQTLVRLRVAGVPAASRALTAGEVAVLGTSALGQAAWEPLTGLAELANLTGFGDTPVDHVTADAAWRHHAAVDALVRRHVPLRRRLLHRLAPTSLVR